MPPKNNNGFTGPPLGPKPGSRSRARAKNNTGLGRALVNQKQKARNASKYLNDDGEVRYTTDAEATGSKDAAWVKLRSVTQERALDEFLSTAELADHDFTTERTANIRIISQGPNAITGRAASNRSNPFLLSAQEQQDLESMQEKYSGELTVPRRPKWSTDMGAAELDRLEKDAFLDWRRGIAALQENENLLLTPFERNVEVWRQLWRVVERSDLVVQIVDARNPLLFRSLDLEDYVKEVNPRKKNLLLINKADLLTLEQRKAWAAYFKEAGTRYAFFSAATALQEVEDEQARAKEEEEGLSSEETSDEDSDEEVSDEDISDEISDEISELSDEDLSDGDFSDELSDEEVPVEETSAEAPVEAPVEETAAEKTSDETKETDVKPAASEESGEEARANYEIMEEDPTRILTVNELEALFLAEAPAPMYTPETEDRPGILQIGLVGYPNVGKSSSINALIGDKKVSVSSTPGKTKHFQTISLSPTVMLCDCPGLVFPNFATTNGDLVCNGVLPIDQLREVTGPVQLVCNRIPKYFLEATYGISIFTRPKDEGGSGVPTAEELLVAYARARGFMRAGQGNPDEARASRYILKDYVNAKLLYCNPPPTYKPDEDDRATLFNKEIYGLDSLPEHRRVQIVAALKEQRPGINLDVVDLAKELDGLKFSQHDVSGVKSFAQSNLNLDVSTASSNLDNDFFANGNVRGHAKLPFHKAGGSASSTKKHFKRNVKSKRGGAPVNFGGTFGDIY